MLPTVKPGESTVIVAADVMAPKKFACVSIPLGRTSFQFAELLQLPPPVEAQAHCGLSPTKGLLVSQLTTRSRSPNRLVPRIPGTNPEPVRGSIKFSRSTGTCDQVIGPPLVVRFSELM